MSKVVKLLVSRKDLIDDIESVEFDGNAEVYDGRIIYNDTDVNDGYTQLDYDSDTLMILRKTKEHSTRLHLDRSRNTLMRLSSVEGTIEMSVKTEELKIDEDRILVIYSLSMDDKVVSRFKQLFTIRRDSDE